MSILEFRDPHLGLQALLIRSSAKVAGINFFTPPENELQLGLMTRGRENPVRLHKHISIVREVLTTQEVLLIRSGRAQVTIWNESLEKSQVFVLEKGDVVLLLRGSHEIEFLETTEILEIKQGPYIADLDKTYL
jgi:hypothetical protein